MVFEWRVCKELARIPSLEEMAFKPLMEFLQSAHCVFECLRLLFCVFCTENDPLFIGKLERSRLVQIQSNGVLVFDWNSNGNSHNFRGFKVSKQ